MPSRSPQALPKAPGDPWIVMRPARPLISAVVALAATGCGRALGPERMPTTTIRGRVLLDGRPVGPGWIEMLPAQGTRGRLRSAPVAADGSFVADGVPIGRLAVRLAGRPLPQTPDPQLNAFLSQIRREHGLRLEVAPGTSAPYEMDLREAMIALQRAAAPRP